MADLEFMKASELAPMIERKEVSPVELTERFLHRIDKLNPKLNAYLTTLETTALEQARKAEEEIVNGRYKGPLHGIPIGIKDNYKTKGIRTTGGAKIFDEYTPDVNATTIDKLDEAGGINLGKLNMHPLGAGSSGNNLDYGVSPNPWNTDHLPGGSSSASATALASGLAVLTTGTDTWGSNRIPAAMSGVYGLKPTHGLVSTHGLLPTAWSLDTAGPFARSVSDIALMLNVMAGFDSKDPQSLNIDLPDYTETLNKDIKGMKIGVPRYYLEGLAPDIETLFGKARKTLEDLGAEVREIDIPELSMASFAGQVTANGEAAAYNYSMMQKDAGQYPQDVRILLSAGTVSSTSQYLKAQQARRKLADAFQKAFEEVDVLLGPTLPITTPEIAKDETKQNLQVIQRGLPFTVPANLTGVPSLAVPMGLSSDGLPAGMQFIGSHLSEGKLMQVGSAWEDTNPISVGYAEIEGSHIPDE
ncbi:amidase [Salinicoccus halitifaciens]|uniref:Aspartyl-tRNA(Asn)/glutamyl-tRNA(Gln) amidotransferase subunit A n=1 Tax=Salinicoccus halitifaciens TaxID=1073415 RepID=A0ABV2EB87_9STAP|nr:amidase [Salinicoccus halitifaciens]MCD2138973.1 Asp-tRNA(Asn)/Glu-tRNA(Gln) amidotransferase GatCAB subunit A [Salinicoccus halitifaciens]